MGSGMHIELTNDEALVLFEFLARFQQTDRLEFAHVSEFLVLSKVSAAVEEALVEPLMPDYSSLLQDERQRVAAGCDYGNDYPGPKIAEEA
jgi:hypothetical protein